MQDTRIALEVDRGEVLEGVECPSFMGEDRLAIDVGLQVGTSTVHVLPAGMIA